MKFSALKQQQGFTLIELMIVVAIIGILAALALPKLNRFQAKAKLSGLEINKKVYSSLQQTYRLTHNLFADVPPLGAGITSGSGDSSTNCNSSNDIGFSLTNCEKAVFSYEGFGYVNQFELAISATGPYPGCSGVVDASYNFNEIGETVNYTFAYNSVSGDLSEDFGEDPVLSHLYKVCE